MAHEDGAGIHILKLYNYITTTDRSNTQFIIGGGPTPITPAPDRQK